ncbi:MAG: helix-turn-helix domain-containing protein, partial [bacterium]|nr:helix-turn-helix domain-containing protein [bacterium]
MIKLSFLLELRNNLGISQAFVAEKIGVSRASYIEIEKGAKELTLSQADKIAEIFNVSIEELFSGKKISDIKVFIQNESEKKEKQETRIDVPQKNLKKFKEVLLYVLEKVGSKSNVGMTVIYKLLYFIDFDYYEKFEEQLIGATYIKNHFGPTPVEFKKIVESMELKGELETVKSKYFLHEQTKYLSR